MVHHALRRLVEGQLVAIPSRYRGVGLDRIVALRRDRVVPVDADFGADKGSIGIAPLALHRDLVRDEVRINVGARRRR